MTVPKPSISVIIPTHNRSEQLAKSLEALTQQSCPAAEFEVIVSADSCEDDTEAMVTTYAAHTPFRLLVVSHQAKNAAATRNLGAAHAQGEILLFIDDDVLPDVDLVQAHLEDRKSNEVIIGYARPALPEKPTWWQLGARLWWEDVFREMREPGHRFTYRNLFSGNFSVPATLFHQVGGFDPSLGGRHEDYELGVRLLKAGAKFRHVPRALGYHYEMTELTTWARRRCEEGVADVRMCQRHPELRTTIFADFVNHFWGVGPSKQLLSLVLMTGSRITPLVAEGILVAARVCESLRLRGLYHNLRKILHDLYFWHGALTEIGGRRRMIAWLEEALIPPAVTSDAPVVDIMALPPHDVLEGILEQANQSGVRLTINGIEVDALRPEAGAEPFTAEHLRDHLRKLAAQQFIPALAIHWIAATLTGQEHAGEGR